MKKQAALKSRNVLAEGPSSETRVEKSHQLSIAINNIDAVTERIKGLLNRIQESFSEAPIEAVCPTTYTISFLLSDGAYMIESKIKSMNELLDNIEDLLF